ncbi:YqhR family membrane protein [Salipaludibacillus sp. HK11]|uniref:YqhR family membrane protein n=1 Tax=Salipaludibacillus sp. HK11 TaxID=3394320 RepID=UPI0039FC5A94
MIRLTKQEKNQTGESPSLLSAVVIIGFVGGVLWSLVGYFAHYFNFTKVGPSMVLMPWALGEWKHGYLGHWIGIVVIGILSIGVAFTYRLILAKVNKFWPGILFGMGIWFVVFGLLNPLFDDLDPLLSLDINTFVTTLSLYSVYGLFIGYSVSYEYHESTRNETEAIQP